MGINSLVRTKGFKNFMAKLYGWGAAVVILGALFKINHYPGAELMLIAGLSTESLIFFFSAFEPPHVEPDWSLVYPELAGMYSSKPELQLSTSSTQELDEMLEEAKIGPELIESLGNGLRSLSDTTSKLSNVSNASAATNDYVENIKTASMSATELSSSYKKTASALINDISASEEYANNIKQASKSASDLSDSYVQASKTVQSETSASDEFVKGINLATQSAQNLAEKYTQSAESLTKSAESIDFSNVDGEAYANQLQKIAQNLAALNTVYESQLKGSSEQAESTEKMKEGMNKFLDNLNASIENTAKYKDEAANLAENVAALNNVYGKMLNAMNVTK